MDEKPDDSQIFEWTYSDGSIETHGTAFAKNEKVARDKVLSLLRNQYDSIDADELDL